MSQAIADARQWVIYLVNRESRGPGDREGAIRRLSNRHGLTYGLIWSLLYRPPRDMMVSKFMSLREAYLTECQRQEQALRHEYEVTKARSLLGKTIVKACAPVDREDD